ncbi:MAG: VacJ family lipoprotein [Halobacteria archaeon]|nr:VacJ family lipoprotein [Halobacteria archaeon]
MRDMMKTLLIVLLLAAYPLSGLGKETIDPVGTGSTTAGPGDDDLFMFNDIEEFIVSDPLEPINRGIFWFNDKLYFYLLKPVARGYRRVVPELMRVSVQNFFSNLATPVRFINSGLQFRFRDAGNELTRFAVNTTLGIGGFFDPAKEHFSIRMKDEDTGQTLGHYGFGPGIYLVLPVLGPSSFRDGIGLLADSRMDLVYYAWEDQDYIGAKVVDAINELSLDKDTYEGIKRDALDPYLFVRDAYIQYRQNKIKN